MGVTPETFDTLIRRSKATRGKSLVAVAEALSVSGRALYRLRVGILPRWSTLDRLAGIMGFTSERIERAILRSTREA